MTPEQFVECFAKERDALLSAFMSPISDTPVALDIDSMRLSKEQRATMRRVVYDILTDCLYTVLMGLDGAASIGGRQELYDLRAEDGTMLTGSGELEALAYVRFHETGSYDAGI